MTAAIVCKGKIHPKDKKIILTSDIICAVNGGTQACLDENIVPTVIIGDIDSFSNLGHKKLTHVPKLVHQKEKDKSDTELAIDYFLALNISHLYVINALGGRLDHAVCNLELLKKLPNQISIHHFPESVYFLNDSILIIEGKKNDLITLLPIKNTRLTTTGLKYELKDATLKRYSHGLSNEMKSKKIKIIAKNSVQVIHTRL